MDRIRCTERVRRLKVCFQSLPGAPLQPLSKNQAWDVLPLGLTESPDFANPENPDVWQRFIRPARKTDVWIHLPRIPEPEQLIEVLREPSRPDVPGPCAMANAVPCTELCTHADERTTVAVSGVPDAVPQVEPCTEPRTDGQEAVPSGCGITEENSAIGSPASVEIEGLPPIRTQLAVESQEDFMYACTEPTLNGSPESTANRFPTERSASESTRKRRGSSGSSQSRISAFKKTAGIQPPSLCEAYRRGNDADQKLLTWFRLGFTPLIPMTVNARMLRDFETYCSSEDFRTFGDPSGERTLDTFPETVWRCGKVPGTGFEESNAPWYKFYYLHTGATHDGILLSVPQTLQDFALLTQSQRGSFERSREGLAGLYQSLRKYAFLGIHMATQDPDEQATRPSFHTFQNIICCTHGVRDSNPYMLGKDELHGDIGLHAMEDPRLERDLREKIILRSLGRCVIGMQTYTWFWNPSAWSSFDLIPASLKPLLDTESLNDPESSKSVEIVATGLHLFATVYATIRAHCREDGHGESTYWTPEDFELVLMSDSKTFRNYEHAVVTILGFCLTCDHAPNDSMCCIKKDRDGAARAEFNVSEHLRELRATGNRGTKRIRTVISSTAAWS